MKKLIVGLVLAVGGLAGFADNLPTPVDGVLTIDIDSDVVYDSAIPSGVTKLIKNGPGEATLATGNDGFTGAIEIQSGTLAGCIKETTDGTGYGYTRSFGDPSSITIAEGATLRSLDRGNAEVQPASPRTHYFSGPLTVGGSGVGGLGAVRFCSENGAMSMHWVWKNVTLTSATTLDTSRRWGFGGGTFDMGGYDLTLIGGNIFELGRSMKNTWVNLGDLYVLNGSSLLWESMGLSPLPAGYQVGDRTCYVSGGGCVRSFTATWADAKFPWSVVVRDTGMIMGFASNTTLDWENNHLWPLDYFGYFHTPVVLADAQTELTTGWYNDSTGDTVNFGAGVSGPGRLIVGNGQWQRGQTVLRGPSTSTLGALKIAIGKLILTNATLVVTNAPQNNQWNEPTGVDSAASPVLIEGTSNGIRTPRLLIENGGVFKTRFAAGVNDGNAASTNDTITLVGHNRNTYGIIDIREGATMTNIPYLGLSGQGALHMRGGNVFFKTKRLGNFGIDNYGAFVMDGGRLTTNAKLEIGTNGRGIFIQRGGVIDFATNGDLSNAFSSQFSLGRTSGNSYGCYYNCGGTLSAPKSQVWLMKHNSLVNGYGAEAFFTLDGASAKAEVRQVKSMVQTSTIKYGVVTLRNGGELSCHRMFRDNFIQECGAGAVNTWANIRNSAFTSRFHLVLDGGILKTAKAGEFFSYEKLDGSAAEGVDVTRLPERVLVYEKGAVIDTSGNDVVFRAPLAAPQGKGLDTVTLPTGDQVKEYYAIGPRRILVTDASDNRLVAGAVIDYDVTNRQQRAVIVTHPGENLPDDVKVRIENSTNNGWTDRTVANGGVTLRTLASGGLTKRGAGTLTLTDANTYGGATRMEGGTLAFTHANGLPSGSALEFAASGLTSGDRTAPLLTASAYNGGAIRITEAETLDAETFGRIRTIARFDTALTALPELTLVKADGTALPVGTWRLALSADRKTLKFGDGRGLVVLVR